MIRRLNIFMGDQLYNYYSIFRIFEVNLVFFIHTPYHRGSQPQSLPTTSAHLIQDPWRPATNIRR